MFECYDNVTNNICFVTTAMFCNTAITYCLNLHTLVSVLPPKDNLLKNIFYFTAAGDWDCVAAVERLPALHYSVDFIFLSFGIMGIIWEL